MSWFYRRLIRRYLFAQDSEKIHHRTLAALEVASGSAILRGVVGSICGSPRLPVELFGLKFPNPVGLAAGMDKLAQAVPIWESLGFGFSELGGITWHEQPGNPKPRIFRAIADEALVNRMGFNNPGAEAAARALATWKKSGKWPSHPVGINLGKSKITPIEEAAQDYCNSFRILRDYGDFFVVNVSSPNTPNLRKLQDKAALDEIMRALGELNQPGKAGPDGKSGSVGRQSKPILIKIAPDLSFEALDEILELCEARGVSGIVATNTTVQRPVTDNPKLKTIYDETGGLSGKPLRARSTEIIRHIYRQTRGKLPIIGVGGIFTADDAWEKLAAGASLLQVYTGLVYEGPTVAKQIVKGLRSRMGKEGLTQLRDAVGCDNQDKSQGDIAKQRPPARVGG